MTIKTETRSFIECDKCHIYINEDRYRNKIEINKLNLDLCQGCFVDFKQVTRFLAEIGLEVEWHKDD